MSNNADEANDLDDIELAIIAAPQRSELFRVGYQNLKRIAREAGMPVENVPSEGHAFEELTRLYGATKLKKLLVAIFLWKRQTIGVSALDPHENLDLEAQALPRFVRTTSFQIEPLFNEALHNEVVRASLFERTDIVDAPEFRMNSQNVTANVGPKMLVMGWSRQRAYAGYLVLLGVMSSGGAGVVAGLATHSLDKGLVTTGTVAGVFTVAEAFIFWSIR